MTRHLERLMSATGHIVAIEGHDCRYGHGYRPQCIEGDCSYVGPIVTSHWRAMQIADEHRRKSAGTWKAAR